MHFSLDLAVPVLARTPATLDALLGGLPAGWTSVNEGGESWSPFDVVGHLVHGEHTDWIPRARIILAQGPSRRFEPFDRFAMLEASRGRSLGDLLAEFARLRTANLETLDSWKLGDAELDLEGEHPAFGTVTLRELLASWVVHDLGHVHQVARVMAKQYAEAVGPWREYLTVLGR